MLSTNNSALSAIRQIKEKHYPKILEDYRCNLLLVEINYSKEKKEYTCVVEDWEKDS